MTQSLQNLTETLNLQNEKLSMEIEIIKSQTSASEFQTNTLLPDGNIIISVIRQLNNAREIDYCAGTSTSFGYITASSCCKGQEIFLFDIEKSDDIKTEENSVWLEEHICFINTTETFEFTFISEDINEPKACSIVSFDDDEGQFDVQIIEIHIQKCFDIPCILTRDSTIVKNQTFLTGSAIFCQESLHFGMVTKSKSQLYILQRSLFCIEVAVTTWNT